MIKISTYSSKATILPLFLQEKSFDFPVFISQMPGQKKVKTRRGFGQEKGHFTDRETAMRHMRFQGQNRGPKKRGEKTGNKSLDTGWSNKKAQVYDEK